VAICDLLPLFLETAVDSRAERYFFGMHLEALEMAVPGDSYSEKPSGSTASLVSGKKIKAAPSPSRYVITAARVDHPKSDLL